MDSALRDFTRVIHMRYLQCPRSNRGSIITRDKSIVTCKFCLKRMNQQLDKVFFLSITKLDLEYRKGKYEASIGATSLKINI